MLNENEKRQIYANQINTILMFKLENKHMQANSRKVPPAVEKKKAKKYFFKK